MLDFSFDLCLVGHLRQNLEADNTASFYFVDGLFNGEPSPYLEYQCQPPNLHFFDFEGTPLAGDLHDLADALKLKDRSTPENAMRRILSMYPLGPRDSVNLTLEYVRNIIEEEGPFHGVIGASEGASAAATVLLNELQISQATGHPSAMQCGIFFVAVPALQKDGKAWFLSDDSDERITAHTCHIHGEWDPLISMSKALYNSCEPSLRKLITHQKGHVIPHEKELMAEVADFVRGLSQETAC